jgi:hypothetical protein
MRKAVHILRTGLSRGLPPLTQNPVVGRPRGFEVCEDAGGSEPLAEATVDWTEQGRAARPGARPRATDRASRRYAPNFCGNCFTMASASGSAIIRM